jgi:DNA polymerase I
MSHPTLPSNSLVFDVETDGLLDVCTRIWVLVIGDLGTGEVTRYTDYDPLFPPVSEGVQRLLGAECLVAHNGLSFDIPAIEKITGVRLNTEKLFDTLVAGRLYNPERFGGHSLDSYGVELGLLKGQHTDWSCYSEEMAGYCEQDVRVTLALAQKLAVVLDWGTSYAVERSTAEVIELQMRTGFQLNVREASMLAASLDQERAGLIAELQAAFPPVYVGTGLFTPKRDNQKAGYVRDASFTQVDLQEFNPASSHHVARRLANRYGWIAPLTEKGNPNITDTVLARLDYPEVPLLLRFARLDKMWTQLASPPKLRLGKPVGGGWLHYCDEAGVVRGYVNSNGAVTGRMTHSRPNSANIDKESRMRALWTARPGRKLVGADAEGLELRMLAHYLWRWDGGAFTASLLEGKKENGTDAHSINRRNTDLFSRDGAKALIYATLYGAGDEKAGETWIADWRSSGRPIREWPAWARSKTGQLKPAPVIGKKVKQSLITGIRGFAELLTAVKVAAQRGWLKGLDGRKLRCRSQHAALNTLLQGGGAVVMKVAVIEYHREVVSNRGWTYGDQFMYVATVHDEVQQDVRPECAEEAGRLFTEAIQRAGRVLGVKCRLDGSYDVGDNWSQTH